MFGGIIAVGSQFIGNGRGGCAVGAVETGGGETADADFIDDSSSDV